MSLIQSARNLGPKSVAMLNAAGIETLEQLQKLGAVRAFLRVKQVWPQASLNLLWALEGALSNTPWQIVAQTERTRLLLELDDLDHDSTNARQNGPSASGQVP